MKFTTISKISNTSQLLIISYLSIHYIPPCLNYDASSHHSYLCLNKHIRLQSSTRYLRIYTTTSQHQHREIRQISSIIKCGFYRETLCKNPEQCFWQQKQPYYLASLPYITTNIPATSGRFMSYMTHLIKIFVCT